MFMHVPTLDNIIMTDIEHPTVWTFRFQAVPGTPTCDITYTHIAVNFDNPNMVS